MHKVRVTISLHETCTRADVCAFFENRSTPIQRGIRALLHKMKTKKKKKKKNRVRKMNRRRSSFVHVLIESKNARN